ncbi:MAG: M20/M25/M40 family metallo-hydrolase [Myxococcaceae bacterium]|nr:M20/M25/M40 family metallo-hydrolase [Myxococcaceae bacterium]MCI0672545.1 M20/M25/M40 family metallo-hydrolase [Myxococcaceae bacterium]
MTALPLLVSLLAASPALSPAEKAAASTITADSIRAHTAFLADDLLEGRGPATRGDALTQAYLAAQFQALGLEPAGTDGSFLQPFDLVGVTGNASTLQVRKPGGKGLTLQHSKDFIAVAGGPIERASLKDAELVFVGYGIQAPEFQWDDFKGMDLRGKVLVILNNDPEDDPKLFGGKTRLWYGRWDYKYLQAAKTGAAGALIIHTTPSAGYPWQVIQSGWTGERFQLPGEDRQMLQMRGWLTEDAARRVLQLAGQDMDALVKAANARDFKPVPLGVAASTRITSKVTRKRTANVVARLPGSDPKLAQQAVLYTAHHDHLGMKPGATAGQDPIYNGAVDNALGTAMMLDVARAFTALPERPRRSILFAAVAAEEAGLLGSEYLAKHLPVPSYRVAADINLDSGNIWGRSRDVAVVGLGKSTLDEPLAELARTQGRVLKPDQEPDKGHFYRSDQFNFARLGIPASFFSSGQDFIGKPEGWGKKEHEAWLSAHYHQPSDELTPSWNLEGAVEDARLAFLLGLRVAQAEQMPRWRPGDEFEDVRRKDLERATKAAP